ncbi:MAG: penicillin acylase family protein [Pseudomonadota bacterium]
MRWQFKALRWAIRGFLAVALLMGLFVGVQYLRALRSVPTMSAQVQDETLRAPARLSRDGYGLAYISAQSEEDALFALGFAHAQDRLWQMDLVRRAATGRMSEVFGSPTLGYDVFMRHWQFEQHVQASWEAMSAGDQARLRAYANGVNAYISGPAYKRSPEHMWLMVDIEPWRVFDSLLVAKMLWPNLSTNLFEEFTRAQLKATVGPAFAADFIRPYPAEGHVAMAWPDLARSLGLPEQDIPKTGTPLDLNLSPARENSNNWVVAGARAASGKPMLANDPHLGLTMPGFWYLAHLSWGDDMAAGGTIPGMPAIVIGHNSHVSWGTTNSHDSDVQDVYREQLRPGRPTQYRTEQGWADFDVRDETIKVRFGKNVVRRYRSTRHGPVLEQGALPIDIPQADGHVYALAWTALQQPDLTLSAIMGLSRARSVEDVQAAADDFAGPPQNVVYAHKDGDIGLVVVGKVPIRAEGHQTKGAAPSDGWVAANQWQGMIPKALTPHVKNPQSGALVTANARVVPPQYPYFRSADASDPSRQSRIAELIEARPRHDLSSFAQVQLDTTAPVIAKLLQALLQAQPADEEAAQALATLRGWDGDWGAEGPAPVLFAQWASLLTQALLWDELGPLAPTFTRVHLRRLADILDGPLSSWCDDVRTLETKEACSLILTESLSASVAALKEQYGSLDALSWRDIQTDAHGHLGLGPIPVVGKWLSRQTNRIAGPDAPNVAGLRADSLPMAAGGGFGPSMRFLVDMAEPRSAQFSISSGQSGHFASAHYDDLQAGWADGSYVTFDPIRASTTEIIEFTPSGID